MLCIKITDLWGFCFGLFGFFIKLIFFWTILVLGFMFEQFRQTVSLPRKVTLKNIIQKQPTPWALGSNPDNIFWNVQCRLTFMSTVDNNINSSKSINIQMVGFEKHSGYLHFYFHYSKEFFLSFPFEKPGPSLCYVVGEFRSQFLSLHMIEFSHFLRFKIWSKKGFRHIFLMVKHFIMILS